jgi:hypothetical protein
MNKEGGGRGPAGSPGVVVLGQGGLLVGAVGLQGGGGEGRGGCVGGGRWRVQGV